MRRSSGARAGTRPSTRSLPPTTRRCAPRSPRPSGSTSSIAERRPVAPVPCARAARARLRHAGGHRRRSGCRRACDGEGQPGHVGSAAHAASWRAPCAAGGTALGAEGRRIMDTDWGHAVVIDPRQLDALRAEGARLARLARRRTRAAVLAFAAAAAAAVAAAGTTARIATLDRRLAGARAEARRARTEAERAALALTALARSHNDILAATEQAPSVGTRSWGRRFTVTKYLPRS